jgi:2-polyprenyl-3-methyl-5-hydroxy-6-metoxy-1,4-benzoquinol methylase
MNKWQSRSNELEILDLSPDHYTKEEYADCLLKLDRIGRWLGGDHATFSAIKRMGGKPSSILDVGCGGGIFATRLALAYPQAKVMGIDLNPQAIEFAVNRLQAMQTPPKNIAFEIRNSPRLQEPEKSYDIVLSTLVCHHMSDAELIDYLINAAHIAKKRVIINDLHRHPLAFYLFKTISPIAFRNRLVQHDGPLSILRAFTYEEWVSYLHKAGIKSQNYQIRWHPMFRWTIEIDCSRSSI